MREGRGVARWPLGVNGGSATDATGAVDAIDSADAADAIDSADATGAVGAAKAVDATGAANDVDTAEAQASESGPWALSAARRGLGGGA